MITSRNYSSAARLSKTLPWSSMTALASFTDYLGAEALVDRMSDDGFPVGSVRIVGTDLSIVEQVTGRLTRGKATLFGLGGGAWFGLLIGFLFSIFTPFLGVWAPMFGSVFLGAAFGAIFGFLGHLASGGRRDFSAVQGFAVGSYEVQVDDSLAASAQKYLI